ncbi:hypothetical protein EWM64_g7806 [Hericium alpestre]|uniref:Uncharacterized protein n=1 Tax=Hericium alpestre TaxID=135208 RepID=A0A4Y9ZMX4_9AGAM|nr:hypothetical protein EWM64_g7806 [Hericium alpestre]
MQERYLGPTLEVLNRDFFDPMLGLPPLRAYIADVEHGPMRIALISMNDPHDDTLEWCSSKETFDVRTHKKCFGIAIFLVKCPSYLVQLGALTYLQRPGVIRPQAFPPPSPINLEAPPIVRCAIKAFLSQSQQMHCVYGMITDEITSVVFDETDGVTGGLSPVRVVAEALSTTKAPIRLTLAMLANEVARKSKGFSGPSAIHVLQGALPPLRSPEELELNVLARRHFRDFDLFTMQRSEEECMETYLLLNETDSVVAFYHGDLLTPTIRYRRRH